LQNNKQNYLHRIHENSTFSLNLPSEISINMQNNPEFLLLGMVNSEGENTVIHAEFTKVKALNEN
ncbi:MAG: hypothetical protein KAR20_07275, partial [Candidatus Heimdallarchaeota archaeon]|nr:hypothetical protein [Candidatus Heimdallarchaeota archaeon]